MRRTIDGATVRYIEYIEKYLTDEYAFFMDCGLTYDGTLSPRSAGSITSKVRRSRCWSTEPCTRTARCPLEPSTCKSRGRWSRGPALHRDDQDHAHRSGRGGRRHGAGKQMRINNIVIKMFETGPGLWYGPNLSNMDEYAMRGSATDMDEPVPCTRAIRICWPGPVSTNRGHRC